MTSARGVTSKAGFHTATPSGSGASSSAARCSMTMAAPSGVAGSMVLVGADRIAANGDVANKVGTHGVALAAQAAGVPFLVVAPRSTIDPATPHGGAMVIEHRDAGELAPLPAGVAAWNPAFDVTPRALVTGYLTDRGFLEPPFTGVTVA